MVKIINMVSVYYDATVHVTATLMCAQRD